MRLKLSHARKSHSKICGCSTFQTRQSFIAVNNEDRQMVVYSRKVSEKNPKGQWSVLSLYCWSAKYQGDRLSRDFYPWVIQPFTGEKALRYLDLVPMQYIPDQAAVRERLIKRGNRYFELNQGSALQDYHRNKFPRIFKDVYCNFSFGERQLSGLVQIFLIILVRPSNFRSDNLSQEPIRVVVDQDTY
jgi:hypothetical protein